MTDAARYPPGRPRGWRAAALFATTALLAAGGAACSHPHCPPVKFSGSAATYAVDVATGRVAWRTPTKEIGSHLEQASGRLLVVSSDEITSLDPSTGARQWRAKYDAAEYRSRVYVADAAQVLVEFARDYKRSTDKIVAIDLHDGSPLWERVVAETFETHVTSSGSTVYVDNGSELLALSARDGRVEWQTQIPPPQSSPTNRYTSEDSPLVVGDSVLVAVRSGGVSAFDRSSGRLRWSRASPDIYTDEPRVTMQPFGTDVAVSWFATSGNRSELHLLDSATGTSRWRAAPGYPAYPAGDALIDAGQLSVSRRSLRDGAPVWTAAVPLIDGPVAVTGSIVAVGHGRRFGDNGIVPTSTLIGLDEATGRQRWTSTLATDSDGTVGSVPTADGGLLAEWNTGNWTETRGQLARLDPATGKPLGRLQLSQELQEPPTVVGGLAYATVSHELALCK